MTGIYLDRQEAELVRQAHVLRNEFFILEGNFIQSEPSSNKPFYVFQRRPLEQIIFGIYDDEEYFYGMLNELIDLKTESNEIRKKEYPISIDPGKEKMAKLREKSLELISDSFMSSNEQRKLSMSNIISNVSVKYMNQIHISRSS